MIRTLYILFLFLIFPCKERPKEKSNSGTVKIIEAPVKVAISNEDGEYGLLISNEQFYIKGAGLEFGDVPSLASHGGNSFRTWRTENGKKSALEVLEEAKKMG